MSSINAAVQDTPVAEVTHEVAPAELPVVETVPEQVYEYQPTDEQGRSLGGKQVIKYRTQDELREKLTQQSVLLIRKLREQTRRQRLGIADTEQIPDTAARYDSPTEFVARQLSDEERVRLSRDLLDPDKFEEASSTLFEATVGANPEKLRTTLSELQFNNIKLTALVESDAFMRSTPEFYRCKENADVLTNWMGKNKLYPSRENFQLAYETLKVAGLLLEAPIVREEIPAPPPQVETPAPTPAVTQEQTPANSQPVQEEPSRITSGTPAQSKRPVSRVASGLTRDQAGDTGLQPKQQSDYTLAQINAMPSDIYRRKLIGEPGFAATVERLENEAREAKKRR